MKMFLRAAVAVVLAGAVAAPAFAERPDATIHFHGGSAGFIVGVSWGDGYLHYRGRRIPIEVKGLQVGTIGGNSYSLDGEVFHLRHVSDIEGTYAAASASATAGAGAGGIDMTNGNGVEVRATSSSAGLKLNIGADGVDIRLKH